MADHDVSRADPSSGPPLGSSRARVLAALRDVGSPTAVGEIADRVGLHTNTARFHLDGLVELGLAERVIEDRTVPGRPRALYVATANAVETGRRSYRLLAQILTSYFATHTRHPEQAAIKAGEAWGQFLTDAQPPFRRLDAPGAVGRLVDALDGLGFAPEAVTAGRQRRVLLHHCPFRETAVEHGEVVCSVHLGLMRGMLRKMEAPLEAQRLDQFVEPNLCVAHLVKSPSPRLPAGG